MFGNSRFERVHQLFADQFEADGSGFLYRKSMKGAAVRVTAAERDGFIATFQRRVRYASWLIILATLLLIGLLVLLVPVDGPSADTAVWVGLAVILVPFLFAFYWAWNAPARELERRPHMGEVRTRAEVRRLMLAKMTYGQLGLAAVGALILVWNVSAKSDVLHGWGIVWLVLAGVLIVGLAFQAFRKWKQERD